MLKNRPIFRFVLLFVSFYLGFIALDQVEFISRMHKGLYASMGEWVYNSWHPDTRAEIGTDVMAKGADPSNDFVLTAYDKKEYRATRLNNARNPMNPQEFKPKAYMAFKSRMSNAIATYFLLALILATPNKWYRKIISSVLGLYLLYILVAMKLTFLLEMADDSKTSQDGWWYFLSGIIGNNESYQELFYILIITIWIFVSISKESIDSLLSTSKLGG
jgi:hypothetical protein